MILTLLAVSLNDQALSRPITARFDAAGGTIGRADHSTMALPDPERFISRKQAEIVLMQDGFVIRNVGAANPISVGSRTLAAGEATPLRDGEEVRIGGYLLRAEVRNPAVPRDEPPTLNLSAAMAPRPAPPSARPAPPPMAPIAPAAPLAAARAGPAATRAPGFTPTLPLGPAAFPATAPLAGAPGAVAPTAPLASGNPFADLLGEAPGGQGAAPAFGAAAPHAADPFADLLAGVPEAPQPYRTEPALVQKTAPVSDPFAGLMPAAAGMDARSPALAAAPPPAAPLLPDDFDPFASGPVGAAPAAAARPVAAAPAAAGDDPFADLLGAGAAAPIEQALGLPPAPADDPLALFASETPAGAGGHAPAPALGADVALDPLALFGDSAPPGPAAAPWAPAQTDHLPAVNAAYTPPRVVKPHPAAAPVRTVPEAPPAFARSAPPASAPASGGLDAQLWQAFCEGAGVQLPLPAGSATDRMRLLGRLLHSAVEGTLQLMSVRASTKHELRAAVTQIQVQGNNPLKFSQDAAAGLAQLLGPPARGFLDGPTAMDDAMHDLIGHAIGTVAGMRAALEGMLDRFDPAALEAKLAGGSMLDSLLPMNRRSKLWELYLQHHRAIREEAQEDFHNLFGKAFVAAYEQQVARLARGGR